MESYIIYLIVFFVISGIVSGISGFSARRRGVNRNNGQAGRTANSGAEKRIRAAYRRYVTEFLAMPNKDIPIPGTDSRLLINKSPFMADFETLSKTLDSSRIELITEECKKYNDLYLDYVDAIIANALTGQFGFSENDVVDILAEFLDVVYVYFLNSFVEDALPYIIRNGSDSDESYLTGVLKDFNNSTSAQFKSYFEQIHNNAGPNGFGFGGFFDQFFNSNNQGQNNYQQDNFEYHDEIGDAYKVLGVSETDTDDKIKKTYRALAKKYHPDRNDTKEARDKMTEINSAYTVIKKKRNF